MGIVEGADFRVRFLKFSLFVTSSLVVSRKLVFAFVLGWRDLVFGIIFCFLFFRRNLVFAIFLLRWSSVID